MTFTLTIDTDNAAFHDDDCGQRPSMIQGRECACFATDVELSTILRGVAREIAQGNASKYVETIRDSNGNAVGAFTLKGSRE